MNKTYLFACGTLRKDFRPKPSVNLDGLVFVGNAKVKGKLYDLGTYPGATEGEGEILGDLFEVMNADETLRVFDEYEGSEFIREAVSILTADGNRLRAWRYRYNGEAGNKPVIENGDYLAYLKTKDSLR